MKKLAYTLLFVLCSQASDLFADCYTTHVKIQNDSSFDCILTDSIKGEKQETIPVVFKNQSVNFDLSIKNLILRYQCGNDASFLLYFFQKYESTASGYYIYDKEKTSQNNLDISVTKKDRKCKPFSKGTPGSVLVIVKDKMN
mgnify:CR=1 FL=1